LLQNRATIRLRFKKFLSEQTLNPVQQKLRDLYAGIAKKCQVDDGYKTGAKKKSGAVSSDAETGTVVIDEHSNEDTTADDVIVADDPEKKDDTPTMGADAQKPTTVQRGDPTRDERIRAAYKEYFSQILVKKVTQDEIARKHGFENEPNVLSKAHIRRKFNVQDLYNEIDEYEKLYNGIRNISDKDKAKLYKKIYDVLTEPGDK